MVFDLDLIKKIYSELPGKVAAARTLVGKPLTYQARCQQLHIPEAKIMLILLLIVLQCRMPQRKWRCYNS